MANSLELVFWHTWWSYIPDSTDWFSLVYHWFNIAECVAWVVFSLLVLIRFWTHRKSRLELWYAAAFVAFAITDFREAWEQSSWLIWLKLVNLILLLWLRRIIMTRHYPAARLV